ncbi:MAG: HAD-IA family hydrolase [Acidimicrobiales bacterium]
MLRAAGLDELLAVRVDGVVAAEERLAGKPAPDTFLSAARLLDVAPADAAVFEDARSGVRAARSGGFGWVVGVDRVGNPHADTPVDADAPTDTDAPADLDADGHAAELRRCGADVVVRDLAELLGPA